MIYLDNASTTKLSSAGVENLIKYSSDDFFNPSSIYAISNSKKVVYAKQIICKKLGIDFNNNLIFTGSASEANNLAFSVASNDFVVSEGEHPSVYNKAISIKNSGKNVCYVPLSKNGQIDYDVLEKILSANTKFISIIHCNNETGAINDLKRIYDIKNKICPDAIFHTDGVQAFCKLPTNDIKYVDLYTISAHKIGGPKGIGALYCKKTNKLKPIIEGGGQEYNLRSGTENLPAIMAFCATVENRVQDYDYIKQLKDTLLNNLDKGIVPNIDDTQTSPYIISLQTTGVNGETMVNALSEKGVYISTGSACSSKKAGNRILCSMGKTAQQIKESIRISLFETNTAEEMQKASQIINQTYLDLKNKLN